MSTPSADSDRSWVFISYSHDSEAHEERVLDLATRLVEQGVDCELDVWARESLEGSWKDWSERMLTGASFVLVVCSEGYKRSFDPESAQDTGASWEAHLIRENLGRRNTRYIPVVLADADVDHVPEALKGQHRYPVFTAQGYEGLYRRLTGQPSAVKPALGKRVALAPRAPATQAFDAAAPAASRERQTPGPILKMEESPARRAPGEPTDEDTFRSWPGWAWCGPVVEAGRRVLRIQPGRGDADFFLATPEFEEVVRVLESPHDVVIRGAPKSGKTRTAWEAIRRFEDAWLLYVRPGKGESLPRVPGLPRSVKKAFLLYDDLEKYDRNQDPDDLLHALDPQRCYIVATLRLDLEERARDTFGRGLEKLESVEIRRLDERTAEEAATGAGVGSDWIEGFDGTLGWIVLGSGAKKEVFEAWAPDALPRAILCTCKLLRTCGVYEYEDRLIRPLCHAAFGVDASDDASWRGAIRELDDNAFLLPREDGPVRSGSLDVYDAHLDQIVDITVDADMVATVIDHGLQAEGILWLEQLVVVFPDNALLIRGLQRSAERHAGEQAVLHHLLGLALAFEEDSLEQELAERRRAVELEPDASRWELALGERLASLGSAESVVHLARAVELDPRAETLGALAGVLSVMDGREPEAIELYRRAVELQPAEPLRWRLGLLLGRTEAGVEEACDLLVPLLREDAYWAVLFETIPDPLERSPRWRSAYLDMVVGDAVRGPAIAPDDLPTRMAQGWLDGDALDARVRAKVEENLASHRDGEDVVALAEGMVHSVSLIAQASAPRDLRARVVDALVEGLALLTDRRPDLTGLTPVLLRCLASAAPVYEPVPKLRALEDRARAVVAPLHGQEGAREAWAMVLGGLVDGFCAAGEDVEADRVLAELEGLVNADPRNDSLQAVLAGAYRDLALLRMKEDDGDSLDPIVARLEELSGTAPENADVVGALAAVHAMVASQNEPPDDALDRAIERNQELLRTHPDVPDLVRWYAWTLAGAANSYGRSARFDDLGRALEALDSLGRQAEDVESPFWTGDPDDVAEASAEAHSNAVLAFAEDGRHEDASRSLQRLEELAAGTASRDVWLNLAWGHVYALGGDAAGDASATDRHLDRLGRLTDEGGEDPELKSLEALGLSRALETLPEGTGEERGRRYERRLRRVAGLDVEGTTLSSLESPMAEHVAAGLAIWTRNHFPELSREEVDGTVGQLRSASRARPENEELRIQLAWALAGAFLAALESGEADAAASRWTELSSLHEARASNDLDGVVADAIATSFLYLGEERDHDRVREGIGTLRDLASSSPSDPLVQLALHQGLVNAARAYGLQAAYEDMTAVLAELEQIVWAERTELATSGYLDALSDAVDQLGRIGRSAALKGALDRLRRVESELASRLGTDTRGQVANVLLSAAWYAGVEGRFEDMDALTDWIAALDRQGTAGEGGHTSHLQSRVNQVVTRAVIGEEPVDEGTLESLLEEFEGVARATGWDGWVLTGVEANLVLGDWPAAGACAAQGVELELDSTYSAVTALGLAVNGEWDRAWELLEATDLEEIGEWPGRLSEYVWSRRSEAGPEVERFRQRLIGHARRNRVRT